MRTSTRLAGFPVCVLAIIGAAWACAPAPAGLSDAHATAIADSVGDALTRFARFSAAMQWDSLGRLYSEASAFRFYESGQLQYSSAAEVRAALAALPPGTRIATEYDDTAVRALAPGVALVSTMFESTFADTAGAAFTFGGALTMVWVHEDGGWRILSGHSSAPVPRGG